MACPTFHQHYRIDVVLGRPMCFCRDCGIELVQRKCATCGEPTWVPRAESLARGLVRAAR